MDKIIALLSMALLLIIVVLIVITVIEKNKKDMDYISKMAEFEESLGKNQKEDNKELLN